MCTSVPFAPFQKGFQKDTDSAEIPLSLLLAALLNCPAKTEEISPALWSKVLHYHVRKENRLLGN